MTSLLITRSSHRYLAALVAGFALSVTACTSIQHDTATRVIAADRPRLAGGVSHTLNYTPWYIHTFAIEGPPASHIRGGGGNTMPMQEDGSPAEGGGKCCTSYPVEWQPNLKLTVRWLVFKDVKSRGAKAPGTWYRAENATGAHAPARGNPWSHYGGTTR